MQKETQGLTNRLFEIEKLFLEQVGRGVASSTQQSSHEYDESKLHKVNIDDITSLGKLLRDFEACHTTHVKAQSDLKDVFYQLSHALDTIDRSLDPDLPIDQSDLKNIYQRVSCTFDTINHKFDLDFPF